MQNNRIPIITLPTKFSKIGIFLLLGLTILIPAIFMINKYIPSELPSGSDMKPFDSLIWQADSSSNWNNGISLREQMLKDVLENKLPGKNKQEIEKILGPSLETNYFRSVDKDLIYYLGPQRDSVLNLDSEWLLIWLNEDGKFKSYKIAND